MMLVSTGTVKCRSVRRIGKSTLEASYLGRTIHGAFASLGLFYCVWAQGVWHWCFGQVPQESTRTQDIWSGFCWIFVLDKGCIIYGCVRGWKCIFWLLFTTEPKLHSFSLNRTFAKNVICGEQQMVARQWTAKMLLSSFCDVLLLWQEKQGLLLPRVCKICLSFCSCCDGPKKGKRKRGWSLHLKSPGSNFYVFFRCEILSLTWKGNHRPCGIVLKN